MDIISGILDAFFSSVFEFGCAFANDNLGSKGDISVELAKTESSTDEVEPPDNETSPETENGSMPSTLS